MDDFWTEKQKTLKKDASFLPSKHINSAANSWLYENRKIEYFISLIPFFFIQEVVQEQLATIYNKQINAYEWVYYNYYKQRQMLYQTIWFCFYFALCGLMVWLFDVSSPTRVGMYTGLQVFFGDSRDACAVRYGDDALMIYLSPEQLIDRNAFRSLRSITEDEKNVGFAHSIYYHPMESSMTITFQMLMSNMERWIHKMGFEDRCVCFYHFGVGIRGGFAQGQFFIDPEISKVGSSTVKTKIGGITYNVPTVSNIRTLVPASCKPVEIRIDDSTNACIQHCSR